MSEHTCTSYTECNRRFVTLETDVKAIEIRLSETDRNLAVTTARLDSVVSSLQSVTKALWGVTAAIGAALLGFVIAYIQNLGGM